MAKTIIVNTNQELVNALGSASGGDKILLAPGHYGNLVLRGLQNSKLLFEKTVSVTSLDPDRPAVIGGINAHTVSNIAFSNLVFDFESKVGDGHNVRPFYFRDASGVSFDGLDVDGSFHKTAAGADSASRLGVGLAFVNSEDIAITNSHFEDWDQAISINGADGVLIDGNEIHEISADGVYVFSTSDITISNNYMHNWRANSDSPAHRDMIQFYTDYTGANNPPTSRDIRIVGNIFDSGSGDWTQTIWMRNEYVDGRKGGIESFYRGVVIEDNLIRNAHIHGVFVGQSVGTVIRNNTLVNNADTVADPFTELPAIRISSASIGGSITGNIAHAVMTSGNTTVAVSGNQLIQRANYNAPNHYSEVFVDGLSDSSGDWRDLLIQPDSPLSAYGSSLSRFDVDPDSGLTAYIEAGFDFGLTQATYAFDARVFHAFSGWTPTNASVRWAFGDGTAATGLSVRHAYAASGEYTVHMTVTDPTGVAHRYDRTIDVISPVVFHETFDKGLAPLLAGGWTAHGAPTVAAGGLRLNGGTLEFNRDPRSYGNEAYTLTVGFRYDAPPKFAHEKLIEFVGGFSISVSAGWIKTSVTSTDGVKWLYREGLKLTDGATHKLSVTFSGADGVATLYLDGEAIATVSDFAGALQSGSNGRGVMLGSIYANNDFTGVIEDVSFVTGAFDAPAVRALHQGGSLAGLLGGPATSPVEPTPPVEPAPPPAPADPVPADAMLFLDFEDGFADRSSLALGARATGPVAIETVAGDDALRLNGGFVRLDRAPEHFQNDEFSLSMRLLRDYDDAATEIVSSFFGGFMVAVGDSFVKASLITTKGTVWLKASDLDIETDEWLDLDITFSGESGEARLFIDGVLADTIVGLEGAQQAGRATHGIELGNAHGANGFRGLIDDLVFRAEDISDTLL